MGDGRVDALNSAVADSSRLPREVRLLERRVEALEEERRALFAELEAWMRRVKTFDQVLKGDTP